MVCLAMCIEEFEIKINPVRTDTIVPGMVVKIKDRHNKISYKYQAISEYQPSLSYTANPANFVEIEASEYGYLLLGIKSLEKRVQYIFDEQIFKFLSGLKLEDPVIYGTSDESPRVICLIKYIGPVNNYGMGHYFSLEYCDLRRQVDGSKKQLNALKHHANVEKGIIASCDEIFPMTDNDWNVMESIKRSNDLKIDFKTPQATPEAIEEYSWFTINSAYWVCDLCTTINNTENLKCRFCRESKFEIDTHQNTVENVENIAWTCKQCIFRNPHTLETCQICNQPKCITFDLSSVFPNQKLTTNFLETKCSICKKKIPAGEASQLKNCGHEFCGEHCWTQGIDRSKFVCTIIMGNDKWCDMPLTEFEIYFLFPETISSIKYIHCGIDLCNSPIVLPRNFQNAEIKCTNCKYITCINCKAVHTSFSCEEYQARLIAYQLTNDMNEFSTDINSSMNDVAENEELIKFSPVHVVTNESEFDCTLCGNHVEAGNEIQFEKCKHPFCKLCIANYIENNLTAEIFCPFQSGGVSCNRMLHLLDIRAIIPTETYECYKQILVCSDIESNQNLSRCFDQNCKGFKLYDDHSTTSLQFKCNACEWINCFECETIHEGLTCAQYKELKGNDNKQNDTIKMFMTMIKSGEAMACPGCSIIIMKDEGCDWVECKCKFEICWVTRGPRWGPGGKNDISGGCRCGVNGRKCHQDCKYCH